MSLACNLPAPLKSRALSPRCEAKISETLLPEVEEGEAGDVGECDFDSLSPMRLLVLDEFNGSSEVNLPARDSEEGDDEFGDEAEVGSCAEAELGEKVGLRICPPVGDTGDKMGDLAPGEGVLSGEIAKEMARL